jgi:ribonuclease HII
VNSKLTDHDLEGVAGVDEAGRGPWAGPVMAAAAMLTHEAVTPLRTIGVNDSKTLTRAKRERCFEVILEQQALGNLWLAVEPAEVTEIDTHNILQATMRAMSRAIAALQVPPYHALIDGNRTPDLTCSSEAIIGGDGKVLSIATASIAAKVTRDLLMSKLAVAHPFYGWERNAGYGTAEHRRGLESYGVTKHHRRSFAPIRKFLDEPTTSR